MHTGPGPDFIPKPFREKGVPLFIHGDDVASVGVGKIWSKAVDCLSFGGLLSARECAFNMHLIIWLVFNNILCTADDAAKTMQVLWQHLTWSLYWLYIGRHPDRDAFGNMYTVGPEFDKANTPLAGGFFGILWAGRMDIDYNQSRFKMARPSEGYPCSCCPAGAGAMPWTDCRLPGHGNTWAGSVYTNLSHAVRFGDNRHRLLRVLPGVGAATYIGDILHCKYLGADQYALGSALALLTHYWMPGTRIENLAIVVAAIREAYRREGVDIKHRYPNLKLSQYKSQKTVATLPKLKGTGMQCKGLAEVMPGVFQTLMDEDNPRHQRVLKLLQGIKATNEIYDRHRNAYRIPAADAERLIQHSFDVAQQTSALIRAYHPDGIVLFHYTIKQHYCLHIALAARYTNPYMWDCSSGEDLMKVAKRLIHGSMFGNNCVQATNRAMMKYAKALHITFDDRQPWWR